MKKVHIVFRPDGEIACLFSSLKSAKAFCEQLGYRYETYSVD